MRWTWIMVLVLAGCGGPAPDRAQQEIREIADVARSRANSAHELASEDEARIAALEKRISSLESRVDDLETSSED